MAGYGIALALLAGIGLWLLVAGLAVLFVQDKPLSELQSALFMITAAGAFVLLRHVLGMRKAGARFRSTLTAADARFRGLLRVARRPIAQQSLALTAIVGAYLHYYYWDVQLQIASLQGVTVFLPVQPTG